MPKKGKELKIISQNEKTKNFKLDEAVLASVLLRDDVKDKPVCVVAVAGAFRKGKSFLLNYFLRYCASQSKENWMGSPSDPLEGFSWVKSSQRETTGILIWSEPFIVKLRSGEEVAILLMDTQGTFDTKSSSKDSTVVFALTLLVSSVVVYNLMGYIQEDDLMNLDAFIQYGLLARGGGDAATAFQKILFLVRDWIHPDESAYGAHGGQQFLDDILEVKKYQDQAHQDLRRNLRKCFSDISCYLMPRPGDVAVTNKYFNGRHSELDGDFVEHLKKLVQLLLAPQNIEKRTLAGQTIKAEDLFKNFKIFADAFNSKDLPDPVHVANVFLQARCEAATKEAKKLYENGMKEVIKDNVLSDEDLDALHLSLYQSALKLFQSYGINERISSSYERQLEEDLASLHNQFKKEKKLKFYKRVAIVGGGVAAVVGGVAAAAAAPAIAAVAGAVVAVDGLPVIAAAISASAAVSGAAAIGIVKAVAAFATKSKIEGAATVAGAVGRLDGAVAASPATAAVDGASAVAGSAGKFAGAVAPSPATAAVGRASAVARATARFVGAVAVSSATALVGGAAAAFDALPVIAANGFRYFTVGLHSILRYATFQNFRSKTQGEKEAKTSWRPKIIRRRESSD